MSKTPQIIALILLCSLAEKSKVVSSDVVPCIRRCAPSET